MFNHLNVSLNFSFLYRSSHSWHPLYKLVRVHLKRGVPYAVLHNPWTQVRSPLTRAALPHGKQPLPIQTMQYPCLGDATKNLTIVRKLTFLMDGWQCTKSSALMPTWRPSPNGSAWGQLLLVVGIKPPQNGDKTTPYPRFGHFLRLGWFYPPFWGCGLIPS